MPHIAPSHESIVQLQPVRAPAATDAIAASDLFERTRSEFVVPRPSELHPAGAGDGARVRSHGRLSSLRDHRGTGTPRRLIPALSFLTDQAGEHNLRHLLIGVLALIAIAIAIGLLSL